MGNSTTYNSLHDLAVTAKCAVDWLIAQGLMPSNRLDVTFPKGYAAKRPSPPLSSPSSSSSPSPPSKRRTGQEEDGPNNNNDHNSGVQLHPPQRQPTKGTTAAAAPAASVDFEDASIPATQRVTALCRELGMQAPRYSTTPSKAGADKYYNGEPDWGSGAHHVPEGLGRVMWVVGSDKARQAVVAHVLEYLLSEYRERLRQVDEASSR